MDSPVDTTDLWVGRQVICRGGSSYGNEDQFLDAHERPQMLHENESTEAERCFLLSFFARIAAALLTSKSFVPCVHWYVQRALSQAVASQECTSMLQLLRFAFRVSLYLLKGLPWLRCPSFRCPYSLIFGILSSSIRTMCPVHLSWHLMIKHSMLGRPHSSPGPGGWTLRPATSWFCRSSADVVSGTTPAAGCAGGTCSTSRSNTDACTGPHGSVYGNLGGEVDRMPWFCKSLFVSRPKAALAFPKRFITSASRDPLLVTVLPR